MKNNLSSFRNAASLNLFFYFILILNVENGFAQPGSTCASPINIVVPSTLTNQTSCGLGADYSTGYCNLDASEYTNGLDVVYRFTAPQDGCVRVNITNLTGTSPFNAFASTLLEGGCPGDIGSVCLGRGEVGWMGDGSTSYRAPVEAGKTYYIIVDVGRKKPTDCITNFNMSIDYGECPPPLLIGTEPSVDCGNNLGFEDGDVSGWTGSNNFNGANYAGPPITPSIAGFYPTIVPVNGSLGICAQPRTTGTPSHTITTGSGFDPNTNNMIPVVAPGGGNYSFRLGDQEASYGAQCIERTFVPTASSPIFTYMYAIISNDEPWHTDNVKARFEMSLKDPGGNELSCGGQYSVTSGAREGDGFIQASSPACGGKNTYYTPWRAVSVDLTPYVGQNMTIKFCTSDCTAGGHYSYAYVDAFCTAKEIGGATLCSIGGSVTLTAPAGFSNYQWYNGNMPVAGVPIGTGPSITVSPSVGDIFTVTYESFQSGACAIQLFATDTIKLFTASVSSGIIVCNNAVGTDTLKASSNDPTATYSWSPATNLSCTNCAEPVLTLPIASTTVYEVTVTSPLGCDLKKTVTVTNQVCVFPVDVTLVGDTICIGDTATITATGSGGTLNYTFDWTGGGITGNSDNGTTDPSIVSQRDNPIVTTTYKVIITDNNNNKDSAFVDIFVYPLATGIDVQTACDSLTWIDGITYTVSNTTATFNAGPAANGCDSIVTLNLTINKTVTTTDTRTACDSLTWIDGITYTASNTTATFNAGLAVNGCDSLVTLDLTINKTVTTTDTQTACDSLTWIDGITYTASNTTATFNAGTTVSGCDSLILLDLTINNAVTVTDTRTVCGSLTWIDGITYTASNTTATFNAGTTVNGCDSLVALNLTIVLPPDAGINGDTTLCKGDPSVDLFTVLNGTPDIGGVWSPTLASGTGVFNPAIDAAGIYTYTVTNAPCPPASSTVTTILNPNPTIGSITTTDANCSNENGRIEVNLFTGVPPFSLLWSTGATDSILANLNMGTYSITITDLSGCKSVYYPIINDPKIDCDSIFIPNVFTPYNKDGNNDVFTIGVLGISKLSVIIYNRWGQRVSNEYNMVGVPDDVLTRLSIWDGRTPSGAEVPEGTYYCIITYTTNSNIAKEHTGYIMLLR